MDSTAAAESAASPPARASERSAPGSRRDIRQRLRDLKRLNDPGVYSPLFGLKVAWARHMDMSGRWRQVYVVTLAGKKTGHAIPDSVVLGLDHAIESIFDALQTKKAT